MNHGGSPFKRILMTVLPLFFLQACDSHESRERLAPAFDRVELYYRDFNTLGFVRLSEEGLRRAAEIKGAITDKESLDRLAELLDLNCVPDQSSTKEEMDLYVLVLEYKDDKLIGKWKASRFHFNRAPSPQLCKLQRVDRDQIERALQSFPLQKIK